MSANRTPHFRCRPAAGHRTRYSWEPAAPLVAAGWPTVPIGMSDAMTEHQARQIADRINAVVDDWRAGRITTIPDVILDLKVVKRDRRPVSKRLARPAAPRGTCGYLIERYLTSPEFTDDLADSTRRSYRPDIDLIRQWCGDLATAAVTAKACKDLYNRLRAKAPTRAAKVVVIGRLLWSWGEGEDLVTGNPWRKVVAKRGRRQVPAIWSIDAVAHFVATADAMGHHGVGTAVMLNSWLGQRKADVLKWDRRMYKSGRLSLTQQKTGAHVDLPLGMVTTLADRLRSDDARAAARGISSTYLIYDAATGRPYTDAGIRDVFNQVRDAASLAMPEIADLDMMRLRHTAVTRLLDAGCTTQQVRAITGHSLASITQIMELYGIVTAKQATDAFRLRMAAEGMASPPDDGDNTDAE